MLCEGRCCVDATICRLWHTVECRRTAAWMGRGMMCFKRKEVAEVGQDKVLVLVFVFVPVWRGSTWGSINIIGVEAVGTVVIHILVLRCSMQMSVCRG